VAVLYARGFTRKTLPARIRVARWAGAAGACARPHAQRCGSAGGGANASLKETLLEMTRKGLGMTAITDGEAACSASSPTAICAACWMMM